MLDTQTQEEQERRTEYARSASWQITPLPHADRQVTGMWRVRDRGNGHRPHTVTLRNSNWDCDCLDCEFNGGIRCKHIEAVRLYLAGEITAQTHTQTQKGDTQMNNRISQFQSQTQKGDTQMNQTFASQAPRWAARQYERRDELSPSWPYVQWINDPGALEPRQRTGGFARPVDQDFPSPGELLLFHPKEGKPIEVVFATELSVAVLATRFAWVLDGVRMSSRVKGARGKLQVACLLRVDSHTVEGPVMLTFTGVAGSRFYAAYRKFARIVRTATRGKAPSYAFWMRVKAGERVLVGSGKEKSYITDVILDEDFDPDRDYVGDEALDSVPWSEIDRWVAAWRRPGPNGEGVIGDEGGTETNIGETYDEVYDETEEAEEERDPANPANWYAEGTWDWAMQQVLPFDGRTAKAGTPLHRLSDEALEYLVKLESQYPAAAKAARILLHVRRDP